MKHTVTFSPEAKIMKKLNTITINRTWFIGFAVVLLTASLFTTLVFMRPTVREPAIVMTDCFDELSSREIVAVHRGRSENQDYLALAQLRSWVEQVSRAHHARNQKAWAEFEVELAATVGSRIDQARAAVPQTVKESTSDGFFKLMKDTTISSADFEKRILRIVERNVFPYMALAQGGGVVAVQRLKQRLEENQGLLLATLATGAPRQTEKAEFRNLLAENIQQVRTNDIIMEQMRSLKISIGLGALVPAFFWKYQALEFKALWLVVRKLVMAGVRKIASRGAVAIGVSFIDGPLPIFDALGALVTGYTIYEVASELIALKKKVPEQVDRNLHETLDAYEGSLHAYLYGLAMQSYEDTVKRQGMVENDTNQQLARE